MLVSTRGRYALRVLIDMAAHESAGAQPLIEIASRQGISEKYLESIVKTLVQHQIIAGTRGKSGGYRLKKDPADITVREILELTESTLAPVTCLSAGADPCPRFAGCKTLPMWRGLHERVSGYLENVSIRDLAENALPRATAGKPEIGKDSPGPQAKPRLKVVAALDSFKGSVSSFEAGQAVARGIRAAFPEAEVINLPVSDGGEGLIETLAPALTKEGFRKTAVKVTGAYGEKTSCTLLLSKDAAVIETAQCCGLYKYPKDKLNPFYATSRGVGEAVLKAIKKGAKKITLGLGGSAVNDGGAGLAQALGAGFYRKDGSLMADPVTGDDLNDIGSVDLTKLRKNLRGCQILCTCDVSNPLLGENGATYIFGPQKGAKAWQLNLLEEGMANYARVINAALGQDYAEEPGAGAAGGLGFALKALAGATLKSGIDTVLDLLGFDQSLEGCSLVITGEGRLDGQSLSGKAPLGVAERAARYNVPAIALGGQYTKDAAALYEHNIKAVFSVCPGPMSLEESMENAAALIESVAQNAVRLFVSGSGLRNG